MFSTLEDYLKYPNLSTYLGKYLGERPENIGLNDVFC